MYEKRNFQHDGKEYEIRVESDGNTIHVRAFFNGKPANGYTYSVEVLTQVDAKITDSLIDPSEELIKTATSDVKNRIWEKYLAAVSAAPPQNA
jgi:hypothetical protein